MVPRGSESSQGQRSQPDLAVAPAARLDGQSGPGQRFSRLSAVQGPLEFPNQEWGGGLNPFSVPVSLSHTHTHINNAVGSQDFCISTALPGRLAQGFQRRRMEIKLLLYEGGCHYVTVHIQSQAAVNCNHSNYLQYIFLRTQVVKDF